MCGQAQESRPSPQPLSPGEGERGRGEGARAYVSRGQSKLMSMSAEEVYKIIVQALHRRYVERAAGLDS
jgi:hypothetical protein